MSLKLEAHLDKFKENMGAYLEKQGERFHQDVKEIERRDQSHCNEKMMEDYIWSLVRDGNLD